MFLIPAIDIKNGHCVRLRQGKMDDVTVFSEDPVAVARRWSEAGAERLHIVDLDGAATGRPVHAELIQRICEANPNLAVQVGGGIRDEEAVQGYLDAGAQWVIIGTRAVTAPHFLRDLCVEYPRHIVVGLDARDGRVAVDGWSKLSHHTVLELAQQFEEDGVEAIVYTDIGRDGMMKGVNVEATRELAAQIRTPVIASGGVSTMDDLRALHAVEEDGVVGAIIGRALYEGTIDFKQAVQEMAGS